MKYSANTKVGTAKVTITGKGIYGGVITKSFAIYPAKQVIQKLYGTYSGFFIDYAQKALPRDMKYHTHSVPTLREQKA